MNFLLSLRSISEYRYDIAAVEQHSDFKYANNVGGFAQTVLNPMITNPRMLRLLCCECFGNSYLGLQLSSIYKVSPIEYGTHAHSHEDPPDSTLF